MKRKVFSVFFLLAVGIVVYGSFYYGVRFTDNDRIGGVIKTKEGVMEARAYRDVRNGCFTEKEITFEMLPDEEYEREALKEEQYEIVEISVLHGKAKVSSDKKSVTIPAGKSVVLQIIAEGTYTGDDHEGEAFIIRRAAPETRIVVIH